MKTAIGMRECKKWENLKKKKKGSKWRERLCIIKENKSAVDIIIKAMYENRS